MTIDIIRGYTFDAGYTFGAHCKQYWTYHVNKDCVEDPATTMVMGRGEGEAVSRSGLMWPELPGSMWPEAVTWRGKKGPWLLRLTLIRAAGGVFDFRNFEQV